MSAATGFRMSNEPAAETAARFKALLAKHGLDYGITYCWDNSRGRGYRHGIIELYDVQMGPIEGVIDSQEFERQTHRWTDADRKIGRIREGSPKHRAIQDLLGRLTQLSIKA